MTLPGYLHLLVYLFLDVGWTRTRLNLVIVGGTFNDSLICLEILYVLNAVAEQFRQLIFITAPRNLLMELQSLNPVFIVL